MKNIGGEKGAAAVEFALVFVLLLIIVFGIIEFGFLWVQSYYIANSAREGARLAVTLPEPKTTDRAQVEDKVKEYLKGIYPDAKVDGAGGCCSTGNFIEVDVSDGGPINVITPPVDTIKVKVTVQTAQIWKPVLWDLLKLLPGIPPTDINEISEYAVFAVQS